MLGWLSSNDYKRGETRMERTSILVTGLIAGLVVGAVAGQLFAPRTGKEARRLLGTQADTLRRKAGEYASTVWERVWREGSGQNGEESSSDRAELPA